MSVGMGTVVGLIKSMGANPEAIGQAVDDWLDDHPEATTTVQDGSISYAKLDTSLKDTVDDVGDLKKQISILFVGNSLTQDAVSYLPYLLKNYFPEVNFKLYIWYNAGYTLAQQYTDFQNNAACDVFSVAENTATWTNLSDTVTMQYVLNNYTFDIVCMQEHFSGRTTFKESDLVSWNNCQSYIQSNYAGSNSLEFISLFHAPRRDDTVKRFELINSGNALILQKTISQSMLPVGIAIYMALSTDLDELGDQEHLSPDGVHAQEGLPCLLQTYVIACWILENLGIEKSIYGCSLRMTTEIYNSIHVPGANLGTGVITGTDSENILAQEIAIRAYKEGRKVTATMSNTASINKSDKLVCFTTNTPKLMQVTGSGNITIAKKNVLDKSTYSKSSPYETNGVTFTLNNDGTVTADGESSGSTMVAFAWTQPFTCDYYYCVNASVPHTVADGYFWDNTTSARCKKWDGTTACDSSTSTSNLQQVRLEKDHYVSLRVRVMNGEKVENHIFYPMLMPKNITDTTFEAYQATSIESGAIQNSIAGINSVFSDANSNVSVKYFDL